MSPDNVVIEHFQNGELVETRIKHNVWTEHGRVYLSRICSDDGYFEQSRIKYMGFGIGGKHAGTPAFGATMNSYYPAGSDPNATVGNKYDPQNYLGPFISSLERPVRVSGSTSPYSSALGTDVWLSGPVAVWYRDINSVSFKLSVDCTGGDYVYGAISMLPVSEAGLFLGSADVNEPFNAPVAYVSFDSMYLTAVSQYTVTWTVRFAS